MQQESLLCHKANKMDSLSAEEQKGFPAQIKSRWSQRLKALDVPPRYQHAQLSDFDEAHQSLINQSLFLTGISGAGKTHLMYALAKRQIALQLNDKTEFIKYQGKDVDRVFSFFVSVPDLIAMLSKPYGEIEESIIELCSTAQWLYLDDFGTEKSTSTAFQALYRIIDHRWKYMYPTVISSNLSIDQMVDDYSKRITSRLAGMGQVIEMAGCDRRLNIV